MDFHYHSAGRLPELEAQANAEMNVPINVPINVAIDADITSQVEISPEWSAGQDEVLGAQWSAIQQRLDRLQNT